MQLTSLLVALAASAVSAERFQAFANGNCGGAAALDVTIGAFDCRVVPGGMGSFFAQPLGDNCGWFAFSGTDCGKGEGFGSFTEGSCSTQTTSGGAAGNVQSVTMKCT